MASVEIPSCPGELPDAENPITLPECRQNLEIPKSPNTINENRVVNIDTVLQRSSFKGSKPSIPIASITFPEPPGDKDMPVTGYRRSDNKRYSFVSDTLANNIRRSGEWLNLGQTNAHGPPHSLEDRLKAAMEKSNVSHHKFLPQCELLTIITQTAVDHELSQFKHLPRKYIRAWKRLASIPIEKQKTVRHGKGHVRAKSDSVVSKQLQTPKEPEEKIYRKIFAILLYIRRPSRIWSFVEEGVCDADLPLIKVSRPNGLEGQFDLRRGSSRDTPLRCLRKWGDIYDFEDFQWIVLAPFFYNSNGKGVPHVELQPDHPLPFTSWKSMSRGGHGQVYRATVHHSHHAFDAVKVPSNIVAVKQLFSKGEKAFAKESEILKNLSTEKHRHDHLITLLATYKQSGIYYLVFPWAKADLEGFWRLNPVPPTDDTDMAKWLVDQCQGLAEALSKIHRYDTRSDTTMPYHATQQQMTSRRLHNAPGVLHLFGRHGDIKSKNILWFPNPTPHHKYGILKITDFGIADFRIDDTVPTPEPPNSRTYRSPECDLEPRRLSTLCDIWALGCVYLVFITWYFGGFEEVETFTEKRRADGHSWNKTDNDHFFTIEKNEGEAVKAKVKNTVIQKIDELRLHANNAELFRDLLDLVQQKMLVIPEEQTRTQQRDEFRESQLSSSLSVPEQGLARRKSSANIARDLGDIQTECSRNPNYVTRAMTVLDG